MTLQRFVFSLSQPAADTRAIVYQQLKTDKAFRISRVEFFPEMLQQSVGSDFNVEALVVQLAKEAVFPADYFAPILTRLRCESVSSTATSVGLPTETWQTPIVYDAPVGGLLATGNVLGVALDSNGTGISNYAFVFVYGNYEAITVPNKIAGLAPLR